MPSTFSPLLRIELIGQGEQSNTWGTTTNTNLGTLIEQAIAGAVTITLLNANYTLTESDGSSDESRRAIILVSGTQTQERTILIPDTSKVYIFRNVTSGGFPVRIQRQSGGGFVSIPNNKTALVICDGSDVASAVQYLVDPVITGGTITGLSSPLAVVSGGTGAVDDTAARANLVAAKSGINNDITALPGLVTPLTVAQGGTNASNANAARANLSAARSGANTDITSLSGLTTPLTLAQGGTGASISPITGGVAFCTSIGVLNLTATPTTTGMVLTGGPSTISFQTQVVAASVIIDGNGAPFSTGIKAYLQIPFNATITSVTLLADQTGSVVVDIWKDTYANYPPTVADSICGASKPTITSSNKYTDSTLTGWTKAITANDVLAFNIDSVTSIVKLTISLTLARV